MTPRYNSLSTNRIPAAKAEKSSCGGFLPLLNLSVPLEEKASALHEFISRWELVGRKVGLGIRERRGFGCDQLFEALPKNNKKAKQQLQNVIHEIIEYNKQEKRGVRLKREPWPEMFGL